MKRGIIIIFFFILIGSIQKCCGCCAGDDRSLTEILFEGNSKSVFLCKILSYEVVKPKDGTLRILSSTGSIDANATAEILETYFGKFDSTIVRLKPAGRLYPEELYLVYGGTVGFGGNCDKWSKPVTDGTKDELEVLKMFSLIFKNKFSGYYVFKMQNIVIAEGEYKKGKPVGVWKHYYSTGIIKSSYDFRKNIIVQYYNNGFIQTRTTVKNKHITIIEVYSTKVNGLYTSKDVKMDNDTGFVYEFFTYYSNGKIEKINSQAYVNFKGGSCTGCGNIGPYKEYFENGRLKISGQYLNRKRIKLWKWYNEDGTFNTQFDYKDGELN